MRVVLMGTPEFAVPTLNLLLSSRHMVLAVVSQPDKAKDRKGNVLFTPLKAAALAAGIEVLQFDSIKKQGVEILKKLNADIFVTAAYGQILSREILNIPKHGVINIHASLLPKYRGSSPIECAILNGETKTGITIMQTEEGLDTGDIITMRETPIAQDETAAELTARLAIIGANLLMETLESIEKRQATFTPQDENLAIKCGKITKEMCKIDWKDTAINIHNRVRALPAYTYFRGRLIKILKTAILFDQILCKGSDEIFDKTSSIDSNLVSGIISNDALSDNFNINSEQAGEFFNDKLFKVYCGKGAVEILRLTPEGGKPMDGKDFLLGIRPLGETVRFD